MLVKEKERVVNEIGRFIWDGFCDPAGVGVNLDDILDGASIVGVDLTEEQKESVYMEESSEELTYSSEFEEVRDLLAAATDCEDYEKMHAWLAAVVGDFTADVMIKEWRGEDEEEF